MTPSHHVRTSALSAASPARSARAKMARDWGQRLHGWPGKNSAGTLMQLDQVPDMRQSARSRSHHRRHNVATPQRSSSCSSVTSAGRTGHRTDPHDKDQEHYGMCSSVDFRSLSRCNLPVPLLTASQARPTEPGCYRPARGRDKGSWVASFDVTLAQRGHVVLSSATGRLERHTISQTYLRSFSARRGGAYSSTEGQASEGLLRYVRCRVCSKVAARVPLLRFPHLLLVGQPK